MAGILCDAGIQELNTQLTEAINGDGNYQIDLFKNNHFPAVSDTLASYTAADFGGYATQYLLDPTDSGPVSHIDTFTFSPVFYTASGSGLPQTVYGYFISRLGVLIGGERFSSSIALTSAGQVIVIVPSLSYQDRSIA